ncbi:MAG: GDP-mannose 4,6-dehydratase [Kiritimatiellia bacterium]
MSAMIKSPCCQPRCPRVLVTGAAGFVGGHLIRELEACGHTVATTDAAPAASLPGYRAADLRDRDALRALVRDARPDACVHLGAISFVPDGERNPGDLLAINIAGTVNLAEALRAEAPACRLLFISTSQVYGPAVSLKAANVPIRENAPPLPLSLYAISKSAAENAVAGYGAAHGLQTLVARPANHIGPGQSPRFVAASFARQILAAKAGEIDEIRVGNLDSIRDFTDVRDVVRAYRLILEHGQIGNAYNIATSERITIRELLDRLMALAGASPRIVVDPELYRPGDASPRLDVSRLREHTGWTPQFTLDQTLADILAASR